MGKNMDELLKRVLTPKEEPDESVNRKILEQFEARECAESAGTHLTVTSFMERKGDKGVNMKNKNYKCAAVIAATALVAAGSMTAYAAWQYRTAAEVADEMEDASLAQAFEQQAADMESAAQGGEMPEDSQSGISDPVGETQSWGGYKTVLLGMVSGEELSEYQHMTNGELRSDRTYLAIAISREDGSPVEEDGDFFVSPLIGDLNPGLNNLAGWGGDMSRHMEDGVLYCLASCDNIEYFADRKLYVCVTDTWLYDSRLYNWDEAAGSIARNEEYEGLNALFELQIDPAKADPAKAQAFLDQALEDSQGGDEDPYADLTPEAREAFEWADKLTPGNIDRYCVRLENTVQTAAPDKDGCVSFEWLLNEEVSDTAGGSSSFPVDWYFKEGPSTFIGASTGNDMSELTIDTYTLNEDGTVTHAVWVPKEGSIYLK